MISKTQISKLFVAIGIAASPALFWATEAAAIPTAPASVIAPPAADIGIEKTGWVWVCGHHGCRWVWRHGHHHHGGWGWGHHGGWSHHGGGGHHGDHHGH